MQAGIGHSVRRKEDARLLSGRGCYSDDVNLPGQAYGAVIRSPHAHARIRAIDTKAARATPGVLVVLSGPDAANDGLKPIPHPAAPGTPPDIVLHNRDGSAVPVAPHHILSIDRVSHVGAAVAFVIAETAVTAKDAAEKALVEYEPLPALTDALAAVDPGAPLLYDDLPNLMIDAEVGDAKATAEAFARAAHVTSLDTWINRVTGVPMEPRAAVGNYDAASGRYTLYAGSGSVQILSHIGSGDGFGLRDLRLIERPHVHVAFAGPSCASDVAQPCCCQVETGLAIREGSYDAGSASDLPHDPL